MKFFSGFTGLENMGFVIQEGKKYESGSQYIEFYDKNLAYSW